VMVEIVVLALPALLVLTMPMAVLVAALYGFSTLAADLEMMAMYASGVSVWRLARPAIAAAVLIGAVDVGTFDQAAPLSKTRHRPRRPAVHQPPPTLALEPQQRSRGAHSGYVLRAQTIAPTDGLMPRVSTWALRFHDGRRGIRADCGRMA